MNAKLCKHIRQWLRLTDVPHAAGFLYEAPKNRKSRGTARYPAGTFEHEYTRLKRVAAAMTAADRAKAFPHLTRPF